jgi:hypothetical protein
MKRALCEILEPLTSIKVLWSRYRGRCVASEKMSESDVRIEEIQAEIRESIDRAKALVAESERFVRDHDVVPPEMERDPG